MPHCPDETFSSHTEKVLDHRTSGAMVLVIKVIELMKGESQQDICLPD